MFQNSFFAGNRKRLRERVPDMPIVITANGLMQRSADAAFPFHQDSGFWYLTGVDEPEAVLVIVDSEEFLIVNQREGVHAAFDGTVDFQHLQDVSGITTIYNSQYGNKRLRTIVSKHKQIAVTTALPAYVDFFSMYTNPARAQLTERLQTYNKDVELVDVREKLSSLRRIKQPVEIEAMQQAVDIVIDGVLSIRSNVYANERDIDADLTAYFRRHGDGNSFEPIVAGGRNACTMHYLANNCPLNQGELLMLDIGAKYNHYSSDISRTYTVKGAPTKRQAAIFDAVVRVQDYALTLLKPGVSIVKYEKQVEKYMGEQLKELGVINDLSREAIRTYYPHATSHYMGIDPHDTGDYEEPLEAGCVVSCEPGIYIPEEGIGIRIEDDILITEDGCRNLSARLPRSLS